MVLEVSTCTELIVEASTRPVLPLIPVMSQKTSYNGTSANPNPNIRIGITLNLSAVDFTQNYPTKMTPQKMLPQSAGAQLQYALIAVAVASALIL